MSTAITLTGLNGGDGAMLCSRCLVCPILCPPPLFLPHPPLPLCFGAFSSEIGVHNSNAFATREETLQET